MTTAQIREYLKNKKISIVVPSIPLTPKVKLKKIIKQDLGILKNDIKLIENYIQKCQKIYDDRKKIDNIFFEKNNFFGTNKLIDSLHKNSFIDEPAIININELLKEYNCLLKENLNLKSKDESFEIEKIKDVLEEISTMGNLHKEAESRIGKLQERYTQLTKECNDLTEQIKSITKTLEGLNIDNPRLNKELAIINNELYPYEKRLNRSFTQMYENNDWKDIEDYYLIKKKKNNNINKKKKHKVTKTSLI
jgi:hypothetical protein